MNTKGQLTMFIILGIVILLVAALGIYFYSKATPTISKEFPVLAAAPREAEPVSSFVTACLEKTLVEGLKYVGSRGGVYDTSSLSYNFMSPTTQGTNAVQFSKDSKIIIPYWHYMSSDDRCDEVGKCEFIQSIPSKDSVKASVEKYIEKNIKTCLGDFEDFQEKGISIQESSSPKATIYIQPSTVAALLDYKLKVSVQTTQISLDKFTSRVNANLNEMLNLGSALTVAEQKYNILENLAKGLIGIYSSIDKKSLPTSGVTFNSAPVFWLKSAVAEKLSRLLTTYVPLIQTGGTRNYRYIKSPPNVNDPKLFETLYNREFYIPLEQIEPGKDYSNFEVKFVYLPEWKLYFDLNCGGEMCLPESAGNTFMFIFNIQKYNFAYDMSFPVMVEIKQSSAFDGAGYTFRYMLEANLRANQPVQTENIPTKLVESPGGGDFCYPEKFNSGKIKVNIIDSTTKKPLDKSQVYFNCINQGCFIGEASKGAVESRFPYCLGGLLSVFNDNYDTTYLPLDPNKNSQTINVELNPFKEIEVKAKKLLVKKSNGWTIDETPADIDSDEHVTVLIKRKLLGFEKDYMTAAEIYGDPLKKAEKIRIAPGTYEVTINAELAPTEDKAIVFPPQEKCVDIEIAGISYDEECFNIPEQPIKFYSKQGEERPLPNGKATFEWVITPEEFKDAKTVEFKFLSIDLRGIPEQDRYIQDFDRISKLDKYIKNSKDLLLPEMK